MKTTQRVIVILLACVAVSCSNNNQTSELQARIDSLQKEVEAFKAEKALVAKNLELFDELDLKAFNNRDMKRIAEIHMPDVRVFNTNNTLTEGFDPKHKEELLWLFNSFSDFDIYEHPIGFGAGDWTAGVSKSRGTFDRPIKLPNGKVIQPTGKKFDVRIATIALWKDGRIVEEYLFWDNEDWMKQIGVY